jgi:hypothetical protein
MKLREIALAALALVAPAAAQTCTQQWVVANDFATGAAPTFQLVGGASVLDGVTCPRIRYQSLCES